jgi:hypothetical protein
MLFVANQGATTALLRSNSAAGIGLLEVYDTDPGSSSRLVNVSARMNVSAGEGTLIAGLIISGPTPKTLLIRDVGPTLSNFAVTGVLADPTITLYSGQTVIATNDNWETGASTAAQITTASNKVGAFPLPAGSKDSSLLVTLPQAGAYTVLLTGAGNTTGVALVEIYEVE